MSEALDNVKKRIDEIIKYRYPHLPNFAITDDQMKKYLKEHKGDLEAIVKEVVKIIVARNKIRRKMKVIK